MPYSALFRVLPVAATLALTAAVTPAVAAEHAPRDFAACAPGSHVYKVTAGTRAQRLTHVNKVRVAPKSRRTIDNPALVVHTITARAAGSGDFDAAAVLQAAHRRYLKNEDAVRSPGDTTSQSPVDIGEATLRNPTAQVRKYAGFAAAIVHRGKWTHQICGDATVLGHGTWRTFSAVDLAGYALCPASRYASRTAAAQACKQAWD